MSDLVVDLVVDLFSGGGAGWCLAARGLGLPSVGIEWDAPSCATRAAAGLLTVRADVASYPAERFAGKVVGLTGSPPCQSFSSAGKRKGMADPRGQLVHEPMRWVRAVRPRWVALEQVPEVLIYWRWIGRELVEMGYSVWTGLIDAADYGVPQNRTRAILLASLDRQAVPPEPTHSKTGEPEMFGPGRRRWVTMAEALGWGLSKRPAYTVCGGDHGGGHHDDGSGQRAQIAKHRVEGRWLDTRRDQRTDGSTQTVGFGQPAPAVTGKAGGQWIIRGGHTNANGPTFDAASRPARTVVGDAAKWCWERPATTVPASFHNVADGTAAVAPPGHHGTGTYTEEKGAVRVELWELGVLQGFPPDHPWQRPNISAQIGNAIPPPLAEACLRALVR